jgi:hypothetical protein
MKLGKDLAEHRRSLLSFQGSIVALSSSSSESSDSTTWLRHMRNVTSFFRWNYTVGQLGYLNNILGHKALKFTIELGLIWNAEISQESFQFHTWNLLPFQRALLCEKVEEGRVDIRWSGPDSCCPCVPERALPNITTIKTQGNQRWKFVARGRWTFFDAERYCTGAT